MSLNISTLDFVVREVNYEYQSITIDT